MAKIKTIDKDIHNIKETKKEVDEAFYYAERVNTSLLYLHYKNGEEVTFVIQNIILYY